MSTPLHAQSEDYEHEDGTGDVDGARPTARDGSAESQCVADNGWRRVIVPEMEPGRLPGHNHLARALRHARLRIHDTEFTVRFQPLNGAAETHFPNSAPSLCTAFRCGDFPVELVLDGFAARTLIEPVMPVGQFLTLSSELDAAVVLNLLSDLISDIERATGWAIEFISAEDASGDWEAAVSDWPLLLEGNGAPAGRMLLRLPSALESALGDLPATECSVNRSQLDPVPVAVGWKVHGTVLSRRELLDLEPGDVILCGHTGSDDTGTYFTAVMNLAGLDRHLNARCYQDRIVILESGEQPMDEHFIAEANAEHDDLPCEVAFIAGEKSMSMGDLRQLEPGAVIELDDSSAHAHVRVMVNGKRFGLGELVQVGERLGIRLLEIKDGTDQ